MFQASKRSDGDTRIGPDAEGEATQRNADVSATWQDESGSRERHRRQGEKPRDRLEGLHGNAQEHGP